MPLAVASPFEQYRRHGEVVGVGDLQVGRLAGDDHDGAAEPFHERGEVSDRDRRVDRAPRRVVAPGVEAEMLLVALDRSGVEAAAGSACSSGAIDPSHVLSAMGMTRERALSSVRFSLGWASTDADVDAALAIVPDAVARLRAA